MGLRRAIPEDIPAIIRLFQDVFGEETTSERWEWKYFHPLRKAASYVWEEDGDIRAHYGGVLLPALYRNRTCVVAAITDLMTHPSIRHRIRRRAPLVLLGEAFYKEVDEEGIAFSYGFAGRASRIFGERFLDYRFVTVLPVYTWECQTPSLKPLRGMDDLHTPFRTIRGLTCGVIRDREYLSWRYAERPDRSYIYLHHEGNAVIAVRTGEGVDVLEISAGNPAGLPYLLTHLPGGGRARAWLPPRLAYFLKGRMDIDESASPFTMDIRPGALVPDLQVLKHDLLLTMGDYDVP